MQSKTFSENCMPTGTHICVMGFNRLHNDEGCENTKRKIY